jgi:hypothetical protein
MNSFFKLLSFLFLITNFNISYTFGQKIVEVSGEAQIEWPDYISKIEAEKNAEDLAIVNALEKAFGRAIIQGNSTYIENINTGQKTETKSGFNMVGNSYVKGELVSVINKKFEELEGQKILDGKKTKYKELKCTITIEAKEYDDPPIEFEAATLSCPDKKCKLTDYKDGDSFYVYFRSESDGYLMIYIDDQKKSDILLPYTGNIKENEGGFPVKANTDYILFHKNNPYDDVDEIQVSTDTYTSLNRLYIVFSKTAMTIPELKNNFSELSESEKKMGYKLPKCLSSEDFLKWITNNKIKRNSFQVETIDISIKK